MCFKDDLKKLELSFNMKNNYDESARLVRRSLTDFLLRQKVCDGSLQDVLKDRLSPKMNGSLELKISEPIKVNLEQLLRSGICTTTNIHELSQLRHSFMFSIETVKLDITNGLRSVLIPQIETFPKGMITSPTSPVDWLNEDYKYFVEHKKVNSDDHNYKHFFSYLWGLFSTSTLQDLINNKLVDNFIRHLGLNSLTNDNVSFNYKLNKNIKPEKLFENDKPIDFHTIIENDSRFVVTGKTIRDPDVLPNHTWGWNKYVANTQEILWLPFSLYTDKTTGFKFQVSALPSGKQPLLTSSNFEKLNLNSVIITDSLDIIDANNNFREGTAMVAFNAAASNYSSVDFSPLQKVQDASIYILVTNHSKVTIEESTLNAQKLAALLKNDYSVSVSFIFIPVYHNNETSASSLETVQVLNKDEFDKLCSKAEERLNLKPFWIEEVLNNDKATVEIDRKNEKVIPPFLLRPFIVRKEVSLLIGQKDIGKSAFLCSIAGAILGNKNVIDGQPWGPLKPQKEAKTNKKSNRLPKVLLLAFEDKGKLESNKDKFTKALLPDKRKADIENFVIEPISGDLSTKDIQEEVLNKIGNAKNKGATEGQVDLIIIDTMTSALGEYITERKWGSVKSFITKIAEENNCAIVVTGHTDTNGNIAGDKSKVISIQNMITLTRKDSDAKTLSDPIDVLLKYKKHTSCPIDIQKFQIVLNDESKVFETVVDRGEVTSKETLEKRSADYCERVKKLEHYYKEEKYTKNQILTLLNMGKEKLAQIKKG